MGQPMEGRGKRGEWLERSSSKVFKNPEVNQIEKRKRGGNAH
jgi:hypothetical protein